MYILEACKAFSFLYTFCVQDTNLSIHFTLTLLGINYTYEVQLNSCYEYPCGFKLNTVMTTAVALIRTENNRNWYDLSL